MKKSKFKYMAAVWALAVTIFLLAGGSPARAENTENTTLTANSDGTYTVTALTEVSAAKAIVTDFTAKKDTQNYQNDRFVYTYYVYVDRTTAVYKDKHLGATALARDLKQHTGIADQGDYIRYSIVGSAVGMLNSPGHQGYRVTIGWNYTSGTMEQEVTETLDAFYKANISKGMSDYKKISIIYQYICDNVAYSYGTENGYTDYLVYTAYGALINKKAACAGYAALFYRMCLDNGIDCRVIDGANHARNVVKLGDRYYVCDTTWDAGKTPDNYQYFLEGKAKASDMFETTDLSTQDIFDSYPVSESAYVKTEADDTENMAEEESENTDESKSEEESENTDESKSEEAAGENDDSKSSPSAKKTICCVKKVSFKTLKRSGKALKLTWKKLDKVSGYIIYRRIRGGTYKKIKIVRKATAYTDKALKKGRIYQYRIRAYCRKNGKNYYGAYSAVKSIKF